MRFAERKFKIRAAAALMMALFAALSFASALEKSATWDETHYLGLGAYLFSHWRWDVPSIFYHPPLPFYLNSVLSSSEGFDDACFRKGRPRSLLAGIRRGHCLLKNSRTSGDRMLLLARIPFIGVGTLLALFVFLFSNRVFGGGAGRGAQSAGRWAGAAGLFSLVFCCFSPNLMAHARLATPDILVTSAGFITVYYFRNALARSNRRDVLFAGLFLGLTLLSKYTGVIFLPILGALAVIKTIMDAKSRPRFKDFLARDG
ncbi:MAG: glycosyltransferase family 39 protein, partial [Desulfobacterales bacterium]|nr:glycosyltransferase family 39 protein [Desulfobacterales bacterium]